MTKQDRFDHKRFASDLRGWRGGRSLRDVAPEAGVCFTSLADIELGRMPRIETFFRLCHWMGIPPGRYMVQG